ncbi:ANTAR domain-containing protein [Bacillota bacterium LX-D]|nr:ANTAR domain-containing protein [Bacillota bacterium LX-D]
MYGFKVFVAEPEKGQRKAITNTLIQTGAIIIGETGDGREAANLIFELQPDLALVSTDLPRRNGFEIARVVSEQKGSPIILVASFFSWEILQSAKDCGAYNLLLKPVESNSLIIASQLAINWHERNLIIEQEKRKLLDELEARKLIERAKGLLVKAKKIDEGEAYKLMRKLSMDQSKNMKQIAREIIRLLSSSV